MSGHDTEPQRDVVVGTALVSSRGGQQLARIAGMDGVAGVRNF